MKTRFLLPCALLLFVFPASAALHAEEAVVDPGYRVLGKENLATDQGWRQTDSRFTPASTNHNASVDFTSNKWSGLTSTLPLDRLEGTFTFHLRGHWTAEVGGDHIANTVVLFQDIDGQEMPGTKNKFFSGRGDTEDVLIESAIPKGAATLRIDVISSHGGTLEIADYDLFLKGVDLSTAAIRGLRMPWLQVPGGKLVGKAPTPDGAYATFTPTPPYVFDDPVWKTLPVYPISTTTSNKTPLNDVAASFQLAWTPDAIFVRFHAHDRILNFNEQPLYQRDCFEFFLLPTGHAPAANPGLSGQEQYTITCSRDGKTEATTDALTRVIPDGWEALAKIPLKTDLRRIKPFNGLTMTFNAAYQDANTVGQEHWLSFSKKDQTNSSYSNPSLYAPLVFETGQTLAYAPMELGAGTAYHVDPKFPGRINLVHAQGSMDNISAYIVGEVDTQVDTRVDAYSEGGHDIFRVKYLDINPQPQYGFTMSPLVALAGETLNLEMEARVDHGAAVKVPDMILLSQSNWQKVSSQVSPGTMGTEWTKLTYTLKLPDNFHENVRTARPVIFPETTPGRTQEFRDIRVTRRLPADFDALISTGSLYSIFWSGEKNTLHFQWAAGAPVKAEVRAEVQDYFTGKTLLAQDWAREMPAGGGEMTWDVSELPNGFFNVLLKVRDDKGGFLADRELYVSKSIKAPVISAFSGVWMYSNGGPAAPHDYPGLAAIYRRLGIGMIQWQNYFLFDNRGEYAEADSLKELKAFHDAGFETGMTVEREGTHDINRLWQPDELEDFYIKFCTRTRGLFTHLSFANEPNLTMGWFPIPDAREWAIYNRGLANVIKKYAPGTTFIDGAFNGVPVKFIEEAASENRNSFADGVVGIHAYGVDGGPRPFQTLMENRQEIARTHPGWDVWDTESGVVFFNFHGILEMLTKKAPLLQCCGITRSYFYDEGDILFPCGDSTPLVAAEGFKNTFYLDTTPVGHVAPADGKAEIYLFKDKAGRGLAVYWNRSREDQVIDLPGVVGGGELFDVFGNPTGTLASGPQHDVLKDRFVRYARGVDLAALTKDASFVPAFQQSHAKPASDPGYTTSVYLSMPYIIRAFDRELTLRQPSEFAISVHNAGATPQKVALGSQGPDGLQIGFEKGANLLLQAGETQVVMVRLVAGKDMSQPQSFSLTGTLADGAQVLPLVFTARTTPPTDVNGYTRVVEMRNNTNVPADVAVSPAKLDYFFTPATIKQRLMPGTAASVPIQITRKENAEHTLNTPIYYDLNVDSGQGTYTKPGISTIFSASVEADGPANFANLPYTAVPRQPGQDKFQVEYNLGWVGENLRITARVQDNSPMQVREGGQLKNGGDCMLVAFDADKGQPPGTFGAGYFECGFAFSNQAPTSYVWDGRYGLETAAPFPEAVRRISRDASYIYYDVTIPGERIFPEKTAVAAGMSIAFVNRTTDGKSELIELGQGILPERDASKLGLIFKDR